MNIYAMKAIYHFEMARTFRSPLQSIASPVISTILYFVVFGSAIGSRMAMIDSVPYGVFIVPGLIMLTVITQSVANASFGIYFPKYLGTIYEPLSAPISPWEMVIGYVGAATTKSIVIGLIILSVSYLFVPVTVAYPLVMLLFLFLTSVAFSLLGFIIGICARNFEQMSIVPTLVLTPLVFLGGSFYSIKILPPIWQTVTLFNPAVYLISGFRWAFFGVSDVSVGLSLGAIALFSALLFAVIAYIFSTGYRLRN
ncbi:ABC transporter permease [Burkholderiales bacterium]|nr:ABC transporter permease [Burkholderiales bacterium]